MSNPSADHIWNEIQFTIRGLLASADPRHRRLGDHFKQYIVRDGDYFRYTGPLKWKVEGLDALGEPESNNGHSR